MQEIHTPKAGEGASVSRRKFMALAAVGSAAALPAVALAEASGKTCRLPPSLEVQLAECVERIKEILGQLHPELAEFGFRDDTYVDDRNTFVLICNRKSKKGGAA